jgi:hypothetical protein
MQTQCNCDEGIKLMCWLDKFPPSMDHLPTMDHNNSTTKVTSFEPNDAKQEQDFSIYNHHAHIVSPRNRAW